MLARSPPQPFPSVVFAIGRLQVQARPFGQLKVDADPMASHMALPATHRRPSPLSFSFIPSTVYEIRVVYLSGSFYSIYLNMSYILAFLLNWFPFQSQNRTQRTATQLFDDCHSQTGWPTGVGNICVWHALAQCHTSGKMGQFEGSK